MLHPHNNLNLNYPKYKILFKYPCRGRVDLFFQSLNSIYHNIADTENFHVSCTIDEDDKILNNDEVMDKLKDYSNLSVSLGTSTSKINAINRDVPNYDFDIIICWSNDMEWKMFGFDDIIRHYAHELLGDDFDGLLHFPEKDSMEHLNVLYIATRKYYDRFGYIYHPSYFSLWCDNESMDVAKLLGKYRYIGTLGLYTHFNPAYYQYNREADELFKLQQGYWDIDSANYQKRKVEYFDLKETEITNKFY